MEAVANAAEDRLVDGLTVKLKPGASYVTDRKSVTFHPQGSNIYSPIGTKVIKILKPCGSCRPPLQGKCS